MEGMKSAQNTAAMLTTFNEIDMSVLMAMREDYKEAFEKKHDIQLGFISCFIKATTDALIEFPEVNASIDGQEVVYRDYVDINVTVASAGGLVVPVIKNCEELSLVDAERSVAALQHKAGSGALALEDFAGGNFTIASGGVASSLFGTAMIKAPQSAILGLHGIQQRAVVVNGEVVTRPMMYVALTYDHRIVDGREGVTFLKKIKESIEDPTLMLLKI